MYGIAVEDSIRKNNAIKADFDALVDIIGRIPYLCIESIADWH